MDALINIFDTFFEKLPEFENAISATAKRSGLTASAALCLMAIYKFPKCKHLCDGILDELFQKGLIEKLNDCFAVTSKGAILAKSFYNVLERNK